MVVVNYYKWPEYITFSLPRSCKIYPNWDFWSEKKPSGNPSPTAQGDQIGRNVAYRAILTLGSCLLQMYPHFLVHFFQRTYKICNKYVGLHFGWFFSQTNLVTLLLPYPDFKIGSIPFHAKSQNCSRFIALYFKNWPELPDGIFALQKSLFWYIFSGP
jgi:hypothetical protein